MTIISSGKIDDFKKVVLDDKVMRALDVKPGNSVLFYRQSKDGTVTMFKAEGAEYVDECDTAVRNHMRGSPQMILICLAVSMVLFIVMMAMISFMVKNIKTMDYILIIAAWAVGLIFLVAALITTTRIDRYEEQTSFVTVGGPYSKNRLTGLSKLLSDGYVVSGNLYINSLFGMNPDSVDVRLKYDNDVTDIALTKCTKAVSGYSIYRIRCMSENITNGKMIVVTTYKYTGKKIVLTSTYDISVKSGSSQIKINEANVEAKLEFDQSFNNAVFDEALFDPNDNDLVY